MANTYLWSIPDLEVAPTEDDKTDVIRVIHYRMTATSDQNDSEGNPYTATTYGTASVEVEEGADFTPFQSITLAWCKEKVLANLGMTEDQLKAQLDADIAGQITPAMVSKLPDNWAA